MIAHPAGKSCQGGLDESIPSPRKAKGVVLAIGPEGGFTQAEIAAAQGGGRPVKLVANLPYNIASPLVIELLRAGVELLAFTVQKEVADRLRATAGTDAYGPLTVTVQLLATVEVPRTLPPQAFWPAPMVESALVRLRRDDRLGGRARAENTVAGAPARRVTAIPEPRAAWWLMHSAGG